MQTEEGRDECVCVAVRCSHMLFVETEEGCDECVCVAACCSHMLRCVVFMCYSRKQKRALMNVCVLRCVAVICCSVLQSCVVRGSGRGS